MPFRDISKEAPVVNGQQAPHHSLISEETEIPEVKELDVDGERASIKNRAIATTELTSILAERWAKASARWEVIGDLEKKGRYKRTKDEIAAIAAKMGKSPQTIYRWMKNYEKNGSIDTFLRKERTDAGASRLCDEVETIITGEIERCFLKRESGTYKDVHREVKRVCTEQSLKVPGITTIRDRFLKLSEKERITNHSGTITEYEMF